MKSFQIFLITCTSTVCTKAATVSYTLDQLSDFQTSGRIIYTAPDAPSSSIATSTLTSIAPGTFRLETFVSAIDQQYIYFHPWLGVTTTPSAQTTTALVDFSIELRDPELTTIVPEIFLTLEQAGNYFVYTANDIDPLRFRPDEKAVFVIKNQSQNLTSEDFARFDFNGFLQIDPLKRPDFSATGSEIQWGFSTVSGTRNSNFQRIVDFKNAQLDITTIPEPSSALLTSVFIVTALLKRRRTSDHG